MEHFAIEHGDSPSRLVVSLCFDCGATITFSRPLTWPFDGVEVSLPRNVHDRVRAAYPVPHDGVRY